MFLFDAISICSMWSTSQKYHEYTTGHTITESFRSTRTDGLTSELQHVCSLSEAGSQQIGEMLWGTFFRSNRTLHSSCASCVKTYLGPGLPGEWHLGEYQIQSPPCFSMDACLTLHMRIVPHHKSIDFRLRYTLVLILLITALLCPWEFSPVTSVVMWLVSVDDQYMTVWNEGHWAWERAMWS